MKINVEFNMPEDNNEMLSCIKGTNLSGIIWDLDQWLRSEYRRDREDMTLQKGEISIGSADIVRDKLRELMQNNDLSFDSPIF